MIITRIFRNPDVVTCKTDNIIYVYNIVTQGLLRLTPLGSKVLEMCDRNTDPVELRQLMEEVFGLRSEEVLSLLERLEEKGIIIIERR